MKVGIFGVGAVGGHVAARLLNAGRADVSLLVREKQRASIAARGLTLSTDAGAFTVHPTQVFSDPAQVEPQDVLIVGLKASSLGGNVDVVRRLLKPDGTVVFLINGVPWWWSYGLETSPRALPLIDRDALLWQRVGPQRVLGCVIYSSNEVTADGTIVNRGKNRYLLGEPDHADSDRLKALVDLFEASDIPATLTRDIHLAIWRKLLRNASVNPIAALTRLSTGQLGSDPHLSDLMLRLQREVFAVGRALGLALTADDADAMQGTSADVRPSMLQDSLLHRPMEVDAILGQAQGFARERQIATPVLDTVLCLLRGLDLANGIVREAR